MLNQFKNISCYEEFEIQCALTGISKIDILKKIGHKVNDYYFFISEDGIFNWFDLVGNHVEDPVSVILKYYACYEPNNIETRKNITEKCNNVLKNITFADFNVVCDESNNTFDVIDNNMIRLDITYRFNKGDKFTVRRYSVGPVSSTFDEVFN